MAALEDLPAELIIIILSYLTLHGHRRCSTVSSLMRSLAEPLLYRDPLLFGRNGCGGVLGNGAEGFEKVRLFVRTIVSRPTLGALVKSLHVRYADDELDTIMSPTTLNAPMTAVERAEALRNIPEQCGVRDDLDFLVTAAEVKGLSTGLILRGGWGSQMVLLLHYLTHLQKLLFHTSDSIRPVVDAALKRLQGGVPIGLMVVEQVRVALGSPAGRERNSYGDLQTCIPFMVLPSLAVFTVIEYAHNRRKRGRYFYTESDDNDEADLDGMDIGLAVTSGTSAVRSLRFIKRGVKPPILRKIMALPQRLERFSYLVGEEEIGRNLFVPRYIAQNLLPHAHCLTFLDLSDGHRGNITEESVLGSLKPFQVLHTLSISVSILLGLRSSHSHSLTAMALTNPLDDLLPSSLVRIDLKLLRGWTFSGLLAVTGLPLTMEKTRERLPSLKTFTIDRNVSNREEILQSDADQAMNAIPGLPLLLELREITVCPPLIAAGQLEESYDSHKTVTCVVF